MGKNKKHKKYGLSAGLFISDREARLLPGVSIIYNNHVIYNDSHGRYKLVTIEFSWLVFSLEINIHNYFKDWNNG